MSSPKEMLPLKQEVMVSLCLFLADSLCDLARCRENEFSEALEELYF